MLLGTLGVLLGLLLKTYMGKSVSLGALGMLLESPGDVLGPLRALLRALGVLLGRLLKTYMGKRVSLGAVGMILVHLGMLLESL